MTRIAVSRQRRHARPVRREPKGTGLTSAPVCHKP